MEDATEYSTDPVEIIRATFRSRISVCVLITGRRDTGKTDMGLLIAEVLGFQPEIIPYSKVATNVRIYPESKIKFVYINSLEDLEYWCKNTQGKKLYIFDEIGKSIRRRSPMSSINIEFIDQLQILRKYKLSMILIAPAEKYIDSSTLGSDILDVAINKPYPKNRRVALYQDLVDNERFTFKNIPSTSIRFDTWDIAPFTKQSLDKKSRFKDEDLEFLRVTFNHLNPVPLTAQERTRKRRLTSKFVLSWLEIERDT